MEVNLQRGVQCESCELSSFKSKLLLKTQTEEFVIRLIPALVECQAKGSNFQTIISFKIRAFLLRGRDSNHLWGKIF